MRISLWGVIALLVFFQVGCSQKQGSYNYAVSDYKATFFMPSKGSDVKVDLAINYQIGNESKSDGFKFVGKNEVADVSCVTGSGDKCTIEIQHLKETKVIWHFSPVRNMTKAVKVSFVIKDQLRREGTTNVFVASWAGIFRVPVEKATYEIIFPQDMNPNIIQASPGAYEKNCSFGVCTLAVTQMPLVNRELAVKYQE